MKKLMQNLSIFLAVIVISTIVAEGLIRVIAPQQLLTPEPGIWKYDDAGFLVHLASINTMINHGEGTHHFITDEKGYRINHTATEYSSTSPDLAILGVGDSFLEAVSVENEETLPELIAREIHAKHGTTFYVANNSCSGWSPYYYYIQARNALEERRYDLGIVLLYTGNDIISPTDTSGVPERERHRQKKRAKFGTKSWFIVNILKPGKTWMESHSHLFNLGKRALFMILIREGKTLGDIPFSFYLENSDSDIWEGTTFWCKKLSAEFAKYDTPVCFIIIPNVWQAEEELFDNYLKFANIDPAAVDIDLPNRKLAEHFDRDSVWYCDPLEYMRECYDQGEQLFGSIDRHLSAQGHQRLAEYFLPESERVLLQKFEEKRQEAGESEVK